MQCKGIIYSFQIQPQIGFQLFLAENIIALQGHNILFKFNVRLNFNFFILDIEPGAKVKLHFHKIYNSRFNLIEWYGEDRDYYFEDTFFSRISLLFILSEKKSF